MVRLFSRKRFLFLTYVLMIMVVGLLGFRIVGHLRTPRGLTYGHYYSVTVNGNVEHPGKYRVPEGTTRMEILRVAGIRLSSDILSLALTELVDKNDVLDVGALANPVSLSPQKISGRLEFYVGSVGISSAGSHSREIKEGLAISDGDVLLTQAESQAEVTLGSFSRVDVDAYAELAFSKMGVVDQGQAITELEQRSGICWYKIVYSGNQEVFKVQTGNVNVAVGGSGAEFVVEVESDQTRIHVVDGLVLAERPGGEAVNVIAGQSLTVYMDARPFQVGRIAMDMGPTERFARLSTAKTEYTKRNMPLNILFCGVPSVYYLCGIRFDKGTVDIINIPAETDVSQFAQGMTTIDQTVLFGGASYTGTVVEQIMSSKISNFLLLTKDDIVRIVNVLGGVSVLVDDKAAAVGGLRRGKQKLLGDDAVKFVNPMISGATDAHRRQMVLLQALFEKFQSKEMVLTALSADQILADVQTNLSSAEAMDVFNRFGSVARWNFKTHALPGGESVVKGQKRFVPDLDLARSILIHN